MMPYLFGLELTVPQSGSQQRERDLSMGRLVARLSVRRTARLRKQLEAGSTAARRTPAPSTGVVSVPMKAPASASESVGDSGLVLPE
jgi:hypothetical protein